MPSFDADTFLKTLTHRPGVYRMFGGDGDILYVGKAKNLRSRVGSYFRKSATDGKTMALVARIEQVEYTVTASETEALLLEQSLIKELRPPYNVVFRDDKSYPYIYLSTEDEYPSRRAKATTRMAARKNAKEDILGRSQARTPFETALTSCRKSFASVSVRTRISKIVRARVFSTRSNVVPDHAAA